MTTGIGSPIAVAGLASLGFGAMADFHCISGDAVKLTFATWVSLGGSAGFACGCGVCCAIGCAAALAIGCAAGLTAFATLLSGGGGGSCGPAGFSQNANHRCASGTGCLVYCVFIAV